MDNREKDNALQAESIEDISAQNNSNSLKRTQEEGTDTFAHNETEGCSHMEESDWEQEDTWEEEAEEDFVHNETWDEKENIPAAKKRAQNEVHCTGAQKCENCRCGAENCDCTDGDCSCAKDHREPDCENETGKESEEIGILHPETQPQEQAHDDRQNSRPLRGKEESRCPRCRLCNCKYCQADYGCYAKKHRRERCRYYCPECKLCTRR